MLYLSNNELRKASSLQPFFPSGLREMDISGPLHFCPFFFLFSFSFTSGSWDVHISSPLLPFFFVSGLWYMGISGLLLSLLLSLLFFFSTFPRSDACNLILRYTQSQI